MAGFSEDTARRVIPRWRDFRTTVSSGELNLAKQPRPHESLEGSSLATKREDWEKHRTIPFASDFVGSAFVLGQPEEAVEAAKFLLSKSSDVSQSATQLAQRVMGQCDNEKAPDPSPSNSKHDILRRQVHVVRGQLRDVPRNPVGWADLARVYTILGLTKQATRCMNVALELAPTNRFILRCASRLFMHLHDPERAHGILRRSAFTKHDPWLLAAEIAVGSAAGKTSKLIKAGRNILASEQYSPWHTTELASALGTVELVSGAGKKARKLFKQALRQPNENAVAQVRWAAKCDPAVALDDAHLLVRNSYEARAWVYYQDADWKSSIQEAWNWFYDEPFSRRPAIHGSYVASVLLEKYDEAANFATAGLSSNPNDFILLNNLVFSLAEKGELDTAVEVFGHIDVTELEIDERVIWLATSGLLCYRLGDFDEGRLLYQQAIEQARALGDKRRLALATTFFALEEIRVESSSADNAVALAIESAKGEYIPELETLRNRITDRVH